MAIKKGVITYSFMYDTTSHTDDEVLDMTIGQILDECDTGHMMGNFDSLDVTEVPNDEVAALEKEFGGDGTFFADPDELEHARLDAEGDEGRPDRDCDPDCSRRAHPAAECDCSRSK